MEYLPQQPVTAPWLELGMIARIIFNGVLIGATLIRSISGMGHVILLMSRVFCIYALAGFPLFQEHGPGHWGTPGAARLIPFQLVTLEGWGEIVQTAMKTHAWSRIYFVRFILFGTFVMLSLFIAVVFNNLEASKNAELEVLPVVPAGR